MKNREKSKKENKAAPISHEFKAQYMEKHKHLNKEKLLI